jgi:hypothetical protein
MPLRPAPGGRPQPWLLSVLHLARRLGTRLGGIVLADSGVPHPYAHIDAETRAAVRRSFRQRAGQGGPRVHPMSRHVRVTLQPPQRSRNPYILDFIASQSVMKATRADGTEGWRCVRQIAALPLSHSPLVPPRVMPPTLPGVCVCRSPRPVRRRVGASVAAGASTPSAQPRVISWRVSARAHQTCGRLSLPSALQQPVKL